MNRALVSLFVSSLLGAGVALAACDDGNGGGGGTSDAGGDATTIIMGAGTKDAGTDADVEATPLPDAGDAAVDAHADAAVDATLDGPAEDAAGDGASDADAAGDADAGAASDASDADAAPGDDASDADAAPGDAGASDAGDAALDADAAVLTTLALVQRYEPPDCVTCAQANHCLDPGNSYLCEDLADAGVAPSGPGVGLSRVDLCLATFQCLASSDCPSTGDMTQCFCGTTGAASCSSGAGVPMGPCIVQEQAGMETLDASVIYNSLFYGQAMPSALGGGVANRLASCMFNNCDSCFPLP
jgi:hypothetical protein